jgi:hypothetical protein
VVGGYDLVDYLICFLMSLDVFARPDLGFLT